MARAHGERHPGDRAAPRRPLRAVRGAGTLRGRTARLLPPLPHDHVKPTFRKKCPSLTFPTPPPAQCTSRAKRMMAIMHTTSQKKKMTIPGIPYPPIVLARTMAPGYPDPSDLFRHEKNQDLYPERTVPSAPQPTTTSPSGRPDTDPALHPPAHHLRAGPVANGRPAPAARDPGRAKPGRRVDPRHRDPGASGRQGKQVGPAGAVIVFRLGARIRGCRATV